jgi:hypothetical protein
MYNIYVYKLQHDDKFLLCPHNSEENVEDHFSAFLYQEIVRQNPISHIVEISTCESWQVDALVHTYMHQHGIENVRGGRYKSWTLSDAEKEEISDAIKYYAFELEEQKSKRERFHKYLQMDNDPIVLKNAILVYDTLCETRRSYKIDRSIIHELNWLLSIIQNPEKKFIPIVDRYNSLMVALGNVFKQFEREIPDAKSKLDVPICELVFSKPFTFFDCRVIPSEREHSNYNFESDTAIGDVVKGFELAIYTLINREDEIIFEMEQIDVQELRDRLFIAETRTI